MKHEYVSVLENTNKYPDEYVGVVDGRTKDSISVICVSTDKDHNSIKRETFELEDWKVRPIKQDVVSRAFSFAKVRLTKDLEDAKSELAECELCLSHSTSLYTEVFK